MACKLKLKGVELDKQTLTSILQQLGNNQDFRNSLIYDNYNRLTSEEANVTTDAKEFLKDMFNLNSIDEVNDAIRAEQVRRDTEGIGKEYSRWYKIAGKISKDLGKVKRVGKSLFSNKGPFSAFGDYAAPLFKAFIKRDGEINVWLNKANKLTEAFQSQMDKLDKYLTDADKIAFSNILKNKNGTSDANWDAIPYTKLEGNPRAEEIKKNIRERLEPLINNMRNHIDESTKFILNVPGLTNRVQASIFLNNLGKYTTVLYEVHRNEDWFSGFKSDKDSKQILDPKKREIFDAAVPHVKKYLIYEAESLNRLKKRKEKAIATISSSTAPLTDQQSSMLTKLKKDIDFIDSRLDVIQGALSDRDLLKIEVVKSLEGMYKGNPLTNMSAGGYRGAMSKDVFKQRKNIPQEIKNLFGEIKDPGEIYLYTIAKMAALAANAEFQTKMFEINEVMQAAYKKNPDKATPPLFSTVPLIDIGLEKSVKLSDAYSVLTGMLGTDEVYMTEDMADFFKSELGGEKLNWFFQTLHSYNTIAKIFATVGSIGGQLRNMYSNTGKILTAFTLSPYKKEVIEQLNKIVKDEGARELFLDEMRRQGLIGSDLHLADIRKSLEASPWIEDFFGKDGLLERLDKGVVTKPARYLKDKAFAAYQFSDDMAKVILFVTESVDHSHAYLNMGYKDLLKNGTPDQMKKIHDLAGTKTANTIPNYNQAWNISKFFQKIGLSAIAGPFAIFRLEQARTFIATIDTGVKEIKNKEVDPEVRRRVRNMGIRRLIGFTALIGASSSTILGILFGDTEDEEEEFISKWGYIPDYMESPILNKQPNRTYEVMDGASVNIYGSVGMFDRAVKDILIGAKEPGDAAADIISKLLQPLYTPQIGTSTVINALKGENKWGQELSTDADSFYERAYNFISTSLAPLIPGTAVSYMRIKEKEAGMKNYLTDLKRLHREGQEEKLIEFQKQAYILAKEKFEKEKVAFIPGVRFQVINPEVELPSKVYDIWATIKDVKPKFKNDTKAEKGDVIKNEFLIDKYKEVRKIYFDNLSKLREFYQDSKAAGYNVDRPLAYGNLPGGINAIELDKPILSKKELEYIMGETNIKPELIIQDFDKRLGIERDNKTGKCLNCAEAYREAIKRDKQ